MTDITAIVPEDVWMMTVGYFAEPYGEHAAKMARGYLEMIYGQGFVIEKCAEVKQVIGANDE